MASLEATATAKKITWHRDQAPIVQNLGPDKVYISRREADATAADGLEIAVGGSFEFTEPMFKSGGPFIWITADDSDGSGTASSDVRIEPAAQSVA